MPLSLVLCSLSNLLIIWFPMSFIIIYLSGEAGLMWTSGSLKICIFHLKWKNWPSDYNLASEIISTLGEDVPICWLKPSGWPNSCNSHYKLMHEHAAFYISGSRSLNNADHALGTLLDPQGPRLDHKPWSTHWVNAMLLGAFLGARSAIP